MREIWECTDSKFCISFGSGFRIACGCGEFPADEVYKYAPIEHDKSAGDCEHFTEGNPTEYSEDDINKAVELYGDDVSSLRIWHESEAI